MGLIESTRNALEPKRESEKSGNSSSLQRDEYDLLTVFSSIVSPKHINIHFAMGDVKACVNSVIKNALTVVDQETGTIMHAFIHLIFFHVHSILRNRFGGLVCSHCHEHRSSVRACLAAFLKATFWNNYSLYVAVKNTLPSLIKSRKQPRLL